MLLLSKNQPRNWGTENKKSRFLLKKKKKSALCHLPGVSSPIFCDPMTRRYLWSWTSIKFTFPIFLSFVENRKQPTDQNPTMSKPLGTLGERNWRLERTEQEWLHRLWVIGFLLWNILSPLPWHTGCYSKLQLIWVLPQFRV